MLTITRAHQPAALQERGRLAINVRTDFGFGLAGHRLHNIVRFATQRYRNATGRLRTAFLSFVAAFIELDIYSTLRTMLRTASVEEKMSKGGKKRANQTGAILESCLQSFRAAGFEHFKGVEYRDGLLSDRYVVTVFPYDTLWGTPGRKEGFVHVDGKNYVVECKNQDLSGSVAEKVAYIYLQFIRSHEDGWIAIFNGRYWRTNPTGIAAINWLKAQERGNKELIVLFLDEVGAFIHKRWGR